MAINFRTTTCFFNDKAKSTMNEAQGKIFKLSQQIETGKYTDSYLDFADKLSVSSFLNLKDTKCILETKIRNNNILNLKLNEMERVIRYMIEDVINGSLKICMQMNNPTVAGTLPVEVLAKEQLSKIQGLLNTSFNGQKLFAGAKTNVQEVVGDIVNISNVNNMDLCDISANYYNGSQAKCNENISSTQQLVYGITADDPAFKGLIAAHHLMISGNSNEALNLLQQTKVSAANLLMKIGNNGNSVKNQIEIDTQALLSIDANICEIEDVDITEIMPQITALEAQLKASFMLTNRLAELSLVNYLK